MSKAGIQIAAKVFSILQEERQHLLRLGTVGDVASTPEGQQDILLAQMLEKAKEAVKEDFCQITMGKLPRPRG